MAERGKSPAIHVMLLAGGSGTRFWPLSRGHRPKQLLPLASRRPLLVETWRRVRKLAPPGRLWVIAPRPLVDDVKRMLPALREENLVVEPSPRHTAPAIGLACATLAERDPAAIAGIFPTDHVIRDSDAFVTGVRAAARAAAAGSLVCLGIRPDRPATGFGYLRCKARPRGTRPIDVERFVEKPDLARARRFLSSGRYLWNGGMFVWRVDRFLAELGRTAPRILSAVRGTLAGRVRSWARATRLSVDYAVMEQAGDVKVVPLDAGWDDVGSWGAATRLLRESGLLDGRHVMVDSAGSAVLGEGRIVALVGVPGITVVDTPDALLVVSNERSQQVREVVEELKRRGRKDLL